MSGPVGGTEQEVILTIVVPLTPSCIFKEAVASGSKAAGSEVSELIPQPLPGQGGQRGRSFESLGLGTPGVRPESSRWRYGAGAGGRVAQRSPGRERRSGRGLPLPADAAAAGIFLSLYPDSAPQTVPGRLWFPSRPSISRELGTFPPAPSPSTFQGEFNSRIASPHWPVAPWPRPRRPLPVASGTSR